MVSMQTPMELKGLRVNGFDKHHMVQLVTQRAPKHSWPCTTLIPTSQAVIDTNGDKSQYQPVTAPLDYQSDQVTELQVLLHKFLQLMSDKLGRTDVLEHDMNVGDAPPITQQPNQVRLAM